MSGARMPLGLLVAFAIAVVLRAGPRVDAQAPLVLKVATVEPASSPTANMIRAFGARAVEASAGQIAPKLFADGTLGGEAATLERVRAGGIQACVVSLEAIAREIPAVGVLLSPYLFRSDALADRRLDGPVRRALTDLLAQRDLVFGAWGPSELRGWATRGPAIVNLDAASSLPHPAPRSSAELRIAEALHMKVVDVPLAPLDMGLGEDTFAAVPASPLEIVAAGLERGATHFTLSDHALRGSVLIYSRRWFEGLPEDPQRALASLPPTITSDARVALRALRPRMIEALTARGVTVVEPSSRERKAMWRAVRDVPNTLARDAGAAGSLMLRAARGS